MTKYFMFLLTLAFLGQSNFSDLISSSYAKKHCESEDCEEGGEEESEEE